jgi:hypothetical protein
MAEKNPDQKQDKVMPAVEAALERLERGGQPARAGGGHGVASGHNPGGSLPGGGPGAGLGSLGTGGGSTGNAQTGSVKRTGK